MALSPIEQMFDQVAAEAIGKSINSFYLFMQEAGPIMFIGSGLIALIVTFAWWRVEPIWNSAFGLKLRVFFHNDINLEWKRPEPFAHQRSYYFKDGDTGYWIGRVDYYFGIENTTTKTIDDAEARVIMAGIFPHYISLRLQTDDNKLSVSIPPKSWRLFRLGHIYTEKSFLSKFDHIDEAGYEALKKKIAEGVLIQHIDAQSSQLALLPTLNNNGTAIQIEIKGRDVAPLFAEFSAIKNKEPALYFVRQSQKDSNAVDIIKRSRKFKFKPSLRERMRLYGINIKQWATGKKDYVSW